MDILEAEACPDHIHMLVCIPPYLSVDFWARGYFVDTVGRNEWAIKEYIRSQLEEDYMKDQMTMKEYIDPFTGSKND